MKYIKLFEDNKTYQYVAMDDGLSLINNIGINMDKKNIDMLIQILKGYIPSIRTYQSQCSKNKNIEYVQCTNNKLGFIVELPDEYFIVYVNVNNKDEIYKCDTIKGIIDLLKDKKLI